VPVRSRRGPEVSNEPMRRFELRRYVDFVHSSLLRTGRG
jgi:hypothetical protein